MSGSGVDTLQGVQGFQALTQVHTLDLRGCPLTQFPRDILQGLEELELVHSDNYKLCCPATLPAHFVSENCHAPSAETSCCEVLLGSNSYFIVLSVFALVALMGNASCFAYLVFTQKKKRTLWFFDVFVVHLNAANFLMGVYLGVIIAADRAYAGAYLWNDTGWVNSAFCRVAGFLYVISSQVSAVVLFLITLDRSLAFRFPFGKFCFAVWSAHVACLGASGVGGLIAAFLGFVTWQDYGQTGICAPLPVDTARFPAIIGANVVFYTAIVVGQGYIFVSVHAGFFSYSDTTRRSQDVIVARRLIAVAVSDCLCWFPTGLASLFAANGIYMSGKVNVVMAIFVLPAASALNPFLYTLNIMLEKLQRAGEDQVKKRLMAHFHHMGTDASVLSQTDIG